MNLYFEDQFGKYRFIQDNVTKDNVFPIMTNYVHQLNPNFTIYYIQSHKTDDNSIVYDVGSHTEFFILTEKEL